MLKEFKLDDVIELPDKKSVITHKVNGYFLHIAKDNPSWIVTNDAGRKILIELLKGITLRQAIGVLKSASNMEDSDLAIEASKLLKEIELNQFYLLDETKRVEDPLILQIYVTNECNLRCMQCYMNAGSKLENELNTDELISAIDSFSEYNISAITFTGGEPLMRKDIIQLLAHAKGKGHKIALLTNGTLLTPEYADRLIPYIDNIQFSLDGTTAEINDVIRGEGVFDKVINAIHYFSNTEIPIHLGMTILKENMEDIYQNLSLLLEDIKSDNLTLSVSSFMSKGRGAYCDKTGVTECSKKIIENLWSQGWIQDSRIRNKRLTTCGYSREVVVNSNGDIYLCPLISPELKVDNLRDKPLLELCHEIKDLSEEYSSDNIRKCSLCDLEYICGGGCRVKNFSENGDIMKPSCTPEKIQYYYKCMVEQNLKSHDNL